MTLPDSREEKRDRSILWSVFERIEILFFSFRSNGPARLLGQSFDTALYIFIFCIFYLCFNFRFILCVSCFRQVIEECLSRYSPSEVCVSFNGGKDCSALLHLVYASWKKRVGPQERLRALYIRSLDPFPEMDSFVQDTQQRQASSSFCLDCTKKNTHPPAYSLS